MSANGPDERTDGQQSGGVKRLAVQLETCSRCGHKVDVSDLTEDPSVVAVATSYRADHSRVVAFESSTWM